LWDWPNNNQGRSTFLNNGQGQPSCGFDFYQCSAGVTTPVPAILTCGSLGMGMLIPNYNLDISGNARFGSIVTYRATTNANARLIVSGNASGTFASDDGQFIITGGGTPANSNLRLGFMVDTTNNVTKIQGGNSGVGILPICLNPGGGVVGIGTASPSSSFKLDVNGNGRIGTYSGSYTAPFAPQLVVSGDITGQFASDNGQIIISGTTDERKRLGIQFDTTNNNVKIQAALATTSTTYPICLNPVGGVVGIGTASPSSSFILDVSGNAIVRTALDYGSLTSSATNAVVTDASGVRIRPKLIFPDNTEQTTALISGTIWGQALNWDGINQKWQITGNGPLAIGNNAGQTNQGTAAIAIGIEAGRATQGSGAIAIGYFAGRTNQGTNSIAIGTNSGETLGANSISINSSGIAPGSAQAANTVVIDASGGITGATANATYISPMRNITQTSVIGYNTTTSEITYWTKTFVIDHPTDKNKYLVHGCLEGPEGGVYYRGEGEITNGESVEIHLPEYVRNLATNFTVQITPIYSGKRIEQLYTSRVEGNRFTVYGENCSFYWLVHGKRCNIEVEPDKSKVIVKGSGPYKWI
jgi:hypothetical protein